MHAKPSVTLAKPYTALAERLTGLRSHFASSLGHSASLRSHSAGLTKSFTVHVLPSGRLAKAISAKTEATIRYDEAFTRQSIPFSRKDEPFTGYVKALFTHAKPCSRLAE